MQISPASTALFSLSRARIDGVLFDLDGVVTNTAALHARAWKQAFDNFLGEWTARTGQPQRPFDIVDDYARHVDGLPRLQGVERFLASRGIAVAHGGDDDPPGAPTIVGLGKQKNALFLALVRGQRVDSYPGTVALIQALRRHGYRIAVVSSSANCGELLASAGLTGLFDARVDGVDLARQPLRGKPAPDMFLEAAHRLGVRPERAVVVEDAVAGVAAGHAGGFEAVIGVDRLGHAAALAQAGATVVVQDLAQVAVCEERGEAP